MDAASKEGKVAVGRAAREGSAEGVRRAVAQAAEHGVEPAALAGAASAALLRAAAHPRNVGVVHALLADAHANPDARNSAGATALHVAAEAGATAVVEELCGFGASLSVRNNEGKTPIAVANGQPCKRIIAEEVERRSTAEKRARAETLRAAAAKQQAAPAAAAPSSSSPATPGSRSRCLPSPARAGLGKLEQELTCGICLRGFCSEDNTEPVTLPCGHNMCVECMTQLKGAEDAPRAFRCPFDRTVFSRTLELRINTGLRDIIVSLPRLAAGSAAKTPTPRKHKRVGSEGAFCDVATSPFSPTSMSRLNIASSPPPARPGL